MSKYIALLDILGFKDLITRNDHEEIVHLFNNFRIYVQRSLAKGETTKDRFGRATFDVRGSEINSIIISDTLIFWTNDRSTNNLFNLIECIQDLLLFCHNLPHLYLRGGISFGEFFYDNGGIIPGKNTLINHPLIVGKGLVDVFEIEKSMTIAGCIISQKAIEVARKEDAGLFLQRWNDLVTSHKILEYPIPYRNGVAATWALNWVYNRKYPTEQEIRDGFSSFNRKVDHPDVQLKIENTVAFYSYVKQSIFIQPDSSTTEQTFNKSL